MFPLDSNKTQKQVYPQELGSILERAQEIARDVVAPNAESVDQDASWPEAGVRALQQA